MYNFVNFISYINKIAWSTHFLYDFLIDSNVYQTHARFEEVAEYPVLQISTWNLLGYFTKIRVKTSFFFSKLNQVDNLSVLVVKIEILNK